MHSTMYLQTVMSQCVTWQCNVSSCNCFHMHLWGRWCLSNRCVRSAQVLRSRSCHVSVPTTYTGMSTLGDTRASGPPQAVLPSGAGGRGLGLRGLQCCRFAETSAAPVGLTCGKTFSDSRVGKLGALENLICPKFDLITIDGENFVVWWDVMITPCQSNFDATIRSDQKS